MPDLLPTGKPKMQSLTIRGAIASAVAVVVVAAIKVAFDVDVETEAVAEIIAAGVALVGSVLAIIGRIRATETIR